MGWDGSVQRGRNNLGCFPWSSKNPDEPQKRGASGEPEDYVITETVPMTPNRVRALSRVMLAGLILLCIFAPFRCMAQTSQNTLAALARKSAPLQHTGRPVNELLATGASKTKTVETEFHGSEKQGGEEVQAAYTLPPALLTKAVALSHIRILLSLGGTAWTILVLLIILWLRWPSSLRNWAEKLTSRRWLQGLVFLPIAILFFALIPLPLSAYGHHVALAYGLSVESWPAWIGDQAKSWLLSLVVFIPLLLLLFWIIRRSPRRWWVWFWLCTIPVVVFAVFISPLWIDPMFNHFSPLQKSDPKLAGQLEQLAHHAGLEIPPSRMFIMQASEKVTGLNAYVTGIGSSERIVVWDNTIRKLPPDEILFVVGHEMGHYVLKHIYKGMAFGIAVLLVAFWLGYLAVGWLIHRWGPQWDIHDTGDWAALAVLALVFVCLGFLFSPVANSFSRWEEHQADIFGQEAIHGLVPDPQETAVQAFNALGRTYLEAPNPNPWVVFWLGSHPSISSRVRFAAHYDPWVSGKRPRYFPR